MDARFYNWNDTASRQKEQKSAVDGGDSRDPAAQAIADIRKAAEHIRSSEVTLDDAKAAAARVIELCNYLEQIPRAAPRSTRSLADRRRGDRRVPPCANDVAETPDGGMDLRDSLCDPRLRALSKRELQVFRLLAEGQSAAEIAERLSRSSKTIHNHRTRILQKLGLKNATELVRLAVRCGLVSI